MTNGLKPYPKYKDSGVPWLGKIPEHWEVLPGRTLFREINDRDHPNEELLSVTISRGVVRQADLLSDSSKKDSSNEDKSAYKLVEPGDIAYNKMRAWQGAVGVSAYRGIVSPAYIVQRLRNPMNSPRYIHYLLRTPSFTTEAERWSYGITSDQWSLRAEDFKDIYFSVPGQDEQTAIVRFLDWADSRIRRVIRLRKKRIKLLEEYKQALINQAVTGRIDVRTCLRRGFGRQAGKPYPKYKDSGVEWLGEVPEHWVVRRLKHATSLIMGQSPSSEDCSTEPIGLPFLQGCAEFGPNNPHPKQFCRVPAKVCPKEAILMSVRAPVGRLNLADQDYGIGRGLCGIVPNPRLLNRDYSYYVLNASSHSLNVVSTGSTYDAVSVGDIGAHEMLLPPLHEQTAIVEFLDEQTERIDAAITADRRVIELLKEFRTRLIADVVTGKVDVRDLPAAQGTAQAGVAAKLPEEPSEEEAAEDDKVTGENDMGAISEEAEI